MKNSLGLLEDAEEDVDLRLLDAIDSSKLISSI
jgi:hypothetical protein